jgi:adenylate cyclase
MPKEIERKYLIAPSAKWVVIKNHTKVARVKQGYLSTGDPEMRIRYSSDYSVPQKVTVKKGSGLVRDEVEFAVSDREAQGIWEMVGPLYLEKDSYWCGDRWQVDVFHGDRFGGLILAEIELYSETEEVVIPDWMALYVLREVTDDPKYKNKNLVQLT